MKVCTAISGSLWGLMRGCTPLHESAAVGALPCRSSMPPPRRTCAASATLAAQLGSQSLLPSLLAEHSGVPSPSPFHAAPCANHSGLGAVELSDRHGRALPHATMAILQHLQPRSQQARRTLRNFSGPCHPQLVSARWQYNPCRACHLPQ